MMRDGLIAARGQILWIALLVGTSLWILDAEGDALGAQPAGSVTVEGAAAGTQP